MKTEIFKSLDLSEYLEIFSGFLSRQKPIFMDGDAKINLEKIKEISNYDIKQCQKVENLDDALMKLSKFGILHISEIFEFSKIIKYFLYLKKINFASHFGSYLEKIEIPAQIIEIANYFDEKGELKEEIDERFYEIKQSYKFKTEEINSELKRLIYSKSITPYLVDTQIHYINNQETLLVRGGFNHALKASVVSRSSGGYFYVIPSAISKLKSEQGAILDKKEELIYEYCKNISNTFNKFLPFLKFINQAFDSVDALIARALMARSRDLEFVLSDSSKDIILKDFAHPALKNPKSISVEFRANVLLITGVNAGGKSMLLKSILTASLLSKYLLPMRINSNYSKIGTFKEFELIMEDPQNVKNDISTFAGRMVAFSKLFHKKNALVGVDEIELGTDFEEAASLYSVLIQQLVKNDIKIIITTHHKRLAMLLSKTDKVELVAALYDEKNSTPKYEFLKGTIGKSYAFETALRYGIMPNLVAQAKKIYGEEKENLNEIISKTLNLEMELKIKLCENEKKSEKLDELISSLKEQKSSFEQEKKEIISKLENEYYKAINEAKRGVNLKDTKEKQRSINKANEIKNSIQIKKEEVQNEPLSVGDFVKYSNIKGQILAINKNDATIICDGIKLRASLSSLKRISKNDMPKKLSVDIKVQKPQKASFMIDLHGLRAEEAINKLDKFINDSLVMGFDEVIVKHGIGTGKLAYAVKEFLKSHPSVKGFSDALPSDGGYGSKVVKL